MHKESHMREYTLLRAVVRARGWLGLPAVLSLCGCFGSVSEVHHRHFLLDGESLAQPAAPQPARPQAPLLPHILWVRDLQVDAVYDRAQLVQRRGPHEVTFSRNDVWAARVGRMLGDAVAHGWLKAGLFAAVNRTATESPADYTLVGEVMALEVVEAGSAATAPQAHLAWVLQVVATQSGRVVAQHLFDDVQPLSPGDAAGTQAAAAFNVLVARALVGGAQAVAEALRDPARSPSPSVLPALP